ncbi:MAG: carbohydrate kinase family protein [Zhenhengia sp.]
MQLRILKTCKLVVAKLVKRLIAVKDGHIYEAASYSVEAIDTTGAGDSFNAGFVYGFLKGKSIEEALKYGNACGGLSATALGGNTGFPQEDELIKFMAKRER